MHNFRLIHISCRTTALAFGQTMRYQKHPVFAESPFIKYMQPLPYTYLIDMGKQKKLSQNRPNSHFDSKLWLHPLVNHIKIFMLPPDVAPRVALLFVVVFSYFAVLPINSEQMTLCTCVSVSLGVCAVYLVHLDKASEMSTFVTVFLFVSLSGLPLPLALALLPQLLQLAAIIVQQIMKTLVIVVATAVVYGISCVNLCPIYEIFTNFSAIIVGALISHRHQPPLQPISLSF